MQQLSLQFIEADSSPALLCERVKGLLGSDLNFHDKPGGYASHNFHSFPAKFPPQLPRLFIDALTAPGELVLDPMVGSGTTVLEALLAGRQAIGLDIDPLALLLTKVKTTPLPIEKVKVEGRKIIQETSLMLQNSLQDVIDHYEKRFPEQSRTFIEYWFAPHTQLELSALLSRIERIQDTEIRAFLLLAFSAIIITKSGGVSLAFDLAHTRPHRAKIAYHQNGDLILGDESTLSLYSNTKFIVKKVRTVLDEFNLRLDQNLKGLTDLERYKIKSSFAFSDAQTMPLADNSIDLIVTSPPYAANAIDYMRAHKFSLVWMGYPVENLTLLRKDYIGGESTAGLEMQVLPDVTTKIVEEIRKVDNKKGASLHRYYSEMKLVLNQMYRVLKPGKAAIIVVGNSIFRGLSAETQVCLAEIGQAIGFQLAGIGIRHLDRNRRMMPVDTKPNLNSQIQQRMHEEYVIGFVKPS